MINLELINYFSERISNGGYVLLNSVEYGYVMEKYEKEEIIDSFIEIFAQNRNKDSVFKEILISDVRKKFNILKEKKEGFIDITSKRIMMKHDYNFDIGNCLGVTQLGHYHNDISNYFHIQNRMECGGYDRVSPNEIWNGSDFSDSKWKKMLKGFLSPLFRSVNDKRQITKHEYRFCFRLSSTVYLAPQFKPEVAKIIIEKFSSNGRVLDFSSGWGDRLAGFYASKNGSLYLGTDPNLALHEGYRNQIKEYGLTEKEKKIEIYNTPAEETDWSQYNNIDLVFTSPPYFSTELYAKGKEYDNLQSWNRYSNYSQWRDDFLFKSIKNIFPVLNKTSTFAINIFNININGDEFDVCGDLYDFMIKNGWDYIGYVGMRMKQRPKNINDNINKEYMASYYVEPIWIFKRK